MSETQSAPIVAAVDPSLSGAAVRVGRTREDWAGGVFNAGPAVLSVTERIGRWKAHASKIVDSACRSRFGLPAIVVIEGYSFGSKGSGTVTLGEFGGIMREQFVDCARLVEVPPTSLKKFVTGKGNASKIELIATMTKRYGDVFNNSDEYDALALWLMGHAMLCGTRFGLVTETQARVAAECLNPRSKPKKQKAAK